MIVWLLLAAVLALATTAAIEINGFFSTIGEAFSEPPVEESPPREPWLRGLVDVTEDSELVTARGTVLPFSPAWEFEHVMATLADVESL